MLNHNPYRPSSLRTQQEPSGSQLVAVAWWLVYLHPAITLTLIYACWTLTTVSLGHPPGFGQHPDNAWAHWFLHLLLTPAGLLTLGTPLFIPMALCWAYTCPFANPIHNTVTAKMRGACLAVYILLLGTAGWISWVDPLRVVYWFVD